jgi:hypothetical protein
MRKQKNGYKSIFVCLIISRYDVIYECKYDLNAASDCALIRDQLFHHNLESKLLR